MATRSVESQKCDDVYKYPLRDLSQNAAAAQQQQLCCNISDNNNTDEANHRGRSTKYNSLCWHLSLVMLVSTVVLALLWTIYLSLDYYSCSLEQRFAHMRRDFMLVEQRRRLGGKLKLSALEGLANDRLLAIKQNDEDVHHIWNDYQLRSYYLSSYKINETDLYTVLRAMPKGGLLHVHDFGLFNTELLINRTYHPDLWTCVTRNGVFEEFRFARRRPNTHSKGEYACQWVLLDDLRSQGKTHHEHKLRKMLSMNGHNFKNSSHMAGHLRRAQRLIYGLVSFRPLFPSLLMHMLEEVYADGINYIELRSALPILYDLDDTNYTIWDTVSAYYVASKLFRTNHEDFFGLKLIYAPARHSSQSQLKSYLDNARFLQTQFPNFVVGFDLNSFGDECHQPTLGTQVQLLHASKQLDFYFHAGESRCPTGESHANLVDAMLLGSKRIGNPINLPQHPEVQRTTKLLKMTAEVCPLSNYYLQYVNDFGQHPAASLIASGHPIVVGSDYPSFWNAAPLTDDFYVTFVGIANQQANLRLLKQLAINSLQFSALHDIDKRKAHAQWQCSWNNWIETLMGQS
ncbi:adenosine deaminase 2 [Drosophila nasuta]|uniref:adenosine deaminase 2 n=1 Tax=Drosophila nasuta TaxID=42062 RepID=UPI00295ED226|nr:adenosine deaminase 2 [Drosophila nasuta]